MRSSHFTALFFASAILSCGPSGPDGTDEGPEEDLDKIVRDVEGALADDKSDSLARPTLLGDILPEVPQEGMFAPDHRFLGWTFAATARPNVNINTVARTRLATVLLWRPACDQPWRTIDRTAADDLSRDLPTDGNYLVVVGPRATNARGSLTTLMRTAQPAAIQPSNCNGAPIPQPVPAPLPQAPTAPVGTLGGSFAVTAAGTASYTVPIDLPPGRAGMQPSIALSYDSGAGNGPVGVGFSISGLSSISRCNKDYAHETRWLAPTYEKDDVYCLDGQRLLSAGTNFYKTERQSFQRIMSTPMADGNDGPAWFRVWTRDGRILTYGATRDGVASDDARWFVRAPSGAFRFRTWYLKEVQDRFGNYYTFEYDNRRAVLENASFETNELVPRRIAYTAHTSGLPATRSVTFTYDPNRPDRFEGNHFGGKIVRSQLLTDIAVDGPSTLASGDPDTGALRRLRTIHLRYQQDPATRQMHVQELEECTTTSTGDVCKPPTLLRWLDGGGFSTEQSAIDRPSIEGWPATVPGPSSRYTEWVPFLNTPIRAVMPMDMDGDGRTDLVFPSGGTWKVARGRADGTFEPNLVNTGSSAHHLMPFDHDGDGRTDLLLHDTSVTWQVLVSTGTGFRQVSTGIRRPDSFWNTSATGGVKTSEGYVRALDLRGDGRPVLYTCSPISHQWTPSLPGAPAGPCDESAILTIDHDGDGRQELMVAGRTGNFFILRNGAPALDTGIRREMLDGSFQRNDAGVLKRVPSWTMTVDVNGDGLDDILNWQPNPPPERGNGIALWINTGGARGFRLADSSLPLGIGADWQGQLAKTVAVDLDRDGIAELVVPGDGLYHWNGTTLERTSGPFSIEAVPPILADVDGDGQVDLVTAEAGMATTVHRRTGARPTLLSEVRDGIVSPLGPDAPASVHVEYSHSGDANVYTGADRNVAGACTFQRACMGAGRTLVASVSRHNGGPKDFRGRDLPPAVTRYTYRDGRSDRFGRGWLGFGSRTVKDDQTGALTTLTYHDDANPAANDFDWRLVGLPLRQEVVVPLDRGAQHRTTTTSELAVTPTTNLAYVHVSTTTDSEAGTVYRSTTQTNTLDANDCPASTVTTWSDGADLTVSRTFATPPIAEWLPCRARTETRTSTALVDGQRESRQQATEVTAYEPPTLAPYRESPLPRITTRDPMGDATTRRSTTMQRDAFGNVIQTTDADVAGNVRINLFRFDAHGMFQVQATNPKGHVTELRSDASTGALLVKQDPNYVSARWAFDGFGRPGLEVRADGSKTRTSWSVVADASTPGTASLVEVLGADESQRAGATRTRFDALGRKVLVTSVGLGGRLSAVATGYAVTGQVERETRPAFVATYEDWPGAATEATVSTYDNLGRRIVLKHADGTITTFTPAGALVTSTDPKGHQSRVTRNPRGQIVESTGGVDSPNQSGATYVYGPFDQLRFATDAAGNRMRVDTDNWGRRTDLFDPDRGHRVYHNDAFDQVFEEIDAAGQSIRFDHDELGRVTARTDRDGTTHWFWDTASYGIGALGSTLSPSKHRVRYAYDALGRPTYVATDVAGTGSFGVARTYDAFSRLLDLEYPQTMGRRFAVRHVYAPGTGVLEHVESASFSSGGGGKLFWQADEANAAGQITGEHFGSGATTTRRFDEIGQLRAISTTRLGQTVQDLEYHFDNKGNLDWRRDGALTESFEHDELDRLHVAHEPDGSPRPLIETSFDALGNIRAKSDVGTYTYKSFRADGSLRPHAVSSAGDASFEYDQNGNQNIRRDASGQLEITYTAFDKPLAYTRAGKAVASFEYDADGDRRVRETATARTVYVAGLYEQSITHAEPSTTEHRYYLQVGGRAIAQVTRTSTRPADRVSYLHGDHLGSVDAITEEEAALTNERPSPSAGPEPTKRSFDAWGKERRPDWRDGAAPLQSSLVHLGFTGHEDDVEGLVNMGGRIYDARLARFLQTDPLVQAPFEPQNLNRYSYVMNRPLGYIDPSGYATVEYDAMNNQVGQYSLGPVTTSEGGDFVHTGQAGPAAVAAAMVRELYAPSAADVAFVADAIASGQAMATVVRSAMQQADLDSALRQLSYSGGSLLERHPNALAAAGKYPLPGGGVAYEGAESEWGPIAALPAYRGAQAGWALLKWSAKIITLGALAYEASKAVSCSCSDDPAFRTGWTFDPSKDLDWRRTGRSWQEGLREAFARTKEADAKFTVTQWRRDELGKSMPVGWRAAGGAEVSIDYGHLNNGPGVPHIGWQTAGKRGDGGGMRGHILLDSVPVGR